MKKSLSFSLSNSYKDNNLYGWLVGDRSSSLFSNQRVTLYIVCDPEIIDFEMRVFVWVYIYIYTQRHGNS